MKIFTEFIILHKNIGFPSEDDFCPYIWESECFDSDGDYYFKDIGDQWTNLDLASFDEGKEAEFELTTYREHVSDMDPYNLKRYIDKFHNNPYYRNEFENLSADDQLAASNITIEAKKPGDVPEVIRNSSLFPRIYARIFNELCLLQCGGFQKKIPGHRACGLILHRNFRKISCFTRANIKHDHDLL